MNGVGVVIGRFQVPELHPGHIEIIREANQHSQLLIFLVVKRPLITLNDPLDYATRCEMIWNDYPDAYILPIYDQPTDEGWSRKIDEAINTIFPRKNVCLYFGRDSAIESYCGKHRKVRHQGKVEAYNGTAVRSNIGEVAIDSPEFRKGIIYASQNMWPTTPLAVDIAIIRKVEGSHGYIHEVLLGQRDEESGSYRFPGGHVDPGEDPIATVKREAMEETHCEIGDLQCIGGYKIDSWKHRDSGNSTMYTIFYYAQYVFGPARGGDDLDKVEWVNISKLSSLKFGDNHDMLALELINYLERREMLYAEATVQCDEGN